ncbi:MAG: hypothetical protein CME06_10365, partial [Gemmatimonadetes bacterium]|nr:hypothetical protein [Gemmatimonadota bacterium]
EALLARGADLFAGKCAICHGDAGGGDGVSARLYQPRPRDLRKGIYHYVTTWDGTPTDSDLFDLLTRGMPGTAMPSWAHLGETDRWALVHFSKSLADRALVVPPSKPPGLEEGDGGEGVIALPPAPANTRMSRERGAGLFEKNCAPCHGPRGRANGPNAGPMVDAAGRPTPVRDLSQGVFKGSSTPENLYRRIVGGIPGTPMPAFPQLIGEEAWDLAHFLPTLIGSKPILAAAEMASVPGSAGTPPSAIDIQNPEHCRPCHAVVVEEWEESMHSHSHQDHDLIYGGVWEMRRREEGAEVVRNCDRCHTPAVGGSSEPMARFGVSCAACHHARSTARTEDRLGRDALVWAGGDTLLGPHDVDPDPSLFHGTGAAPPHMKEPPRLCEVCHDGLINSAGVVICSTGPEARESPTEESCTDCHMPRVQGPNGAVGRREDHASHEFLGPHRAWYQGDSAFLGSGIEMASRLEGHSLVVCLLNTAGHSFPTGLPGRRAVVEAIGYDAKGRKTWRNWTRNPVQESPKSIMGIGFVDAEGKWVMSDHAVAVGIDTRLEAASEREMTYRVPPRVRSVRVRLVFHLLWARYIVRKTGLGGLPELRPAVIKESWAYREPARGEGQELVP